MGIISSFLSDLRDLVFPPTCRICGVNESRRTICSECLNRRFNRASDFETLLPEGVTQRFALWSFEKGEAIQDILHAIKYKNDYALAVDCGRLLAQRVQSEMDESIRAGLSGGAETWSVVAIPLHEKKMRIRGYNQARRIAEGFEKMDGFQLIQEKVFIRNRFTQTQTGFGLEERRQNMKGVFTADKKAVLGKHILIVDDVFTTGATCFEAAESLLKAGAASCCIATLAAT